MTERCSMPRCPGEVEILYLDCGLCDFHWNQLNAGDAPTDALRMALGLTTDGDSAMEEEMATKKKTTRKATKKAGTKKKTPKRKAANGPKPNRVFAIRVTDGELAAIHRAAGPRNATRFIRAVAAAFAKEDEAAFRSVLKEARQARS